MQQDVKNMMEEKPRKLMTVIVVLSLFVVTLFGFVPTV